MKQAIVVTTVPQSGEWLANFFGKLNGYDKYPILAIADYKFELGKIRWMLEHTDVEEFFVLHDTCEIKDISLFDLVFEKYKGKSVALSNSPAMFGMYLGKYRREVLKNMRLPRPATKLANVRYEISFNSEYAKRDPSTVLLFPNFVDNYVFEKKLGRVNMKLENKYLIKWKSTWRPEMIR